MAWVNRQSTVVGRATRGNLATPGRSPLVHGVVNNGRHARYARTVWLYNLNHQR